MSASEVRVGRPTCVTSMHAWGVTLLWWMCALNWSERGAQWRAKFMMVYNYNSMWAPPMIIYLHLDCSQVEEVRHTSCGTFRIDHVLCNPTMDLSSLLPITPISNSWFGQSTRLGSHARNEREWMGRRKHGWWTRVARTASMGGDRWVSEHVGECSGRFIPKALLYLP